jgi:hypothetical protein
MVLCSAYFQVTKYQKMLKKRLENIENYEIPKEEFAFPAIPDGSIAAYTFSLSDGVRWRVSSSVVHNCRGHS